MKLNEEQLERYSRQIMLEQVGEEGQKKLLRAKVLVIGAGGLGSPVVLYLAGAGVGTIGIADADVVDCSNLQRQIIHTTKSVGTNKTESAKRAVLALNPEVQVNTYPAFVTMETIRELIQEYDFIVDATDNFASKFLINDACVMAKKAFSHAGIREFQGQLMTYVPGEGACLRCIFKEMPQKAADAKEDKLGIIGAVAGVIGSLQAMEAVKYILGEGKLLTGKLLTYDALAMRFRTVEFLKEDACPVCGNSGDCGC